MPRIRWLSHPEDHDYAAARDYLELIAPPLSVEPIVTALRKAPTVTRKSKDLLRASGLVPLDAHNPHVAKDLHKIQSDLELSPVLLLRGDIQHGRPLTVADGYHRICAVHLIDEDSEIPCRIVDPH